MGSVFFQLLPPNLVAVEDSLMRLFDCQPDKVAKTIKKTFRKNIFCHATNVFIFHAR